MSARLSPARAALLVAGVELRRRLRSRSFLVQAVVGPLVLAAIVTLAFDTGSANDVSVAVGIADLDRSDVSGAFVAAATGRGEDGTDEPAADHDWSRPFVVLEPDQARQMVADDQLKTVIVIPEGFGASTTSDDPLDLEVLSSPEFVLDAAVARAYAEGLASRVNTARLAAAVTAAEGGSPPSDEELSAIEPPVRSRLRGSGGEFSLASYFGPSMGLLFLFLTVGVVARSLLEDKRLGVLDRVRAGPVPSSSLLAGKALTAIAVGVSSLAVMWLVTTLALGADWGEPAGVSLLIVTSALAIAGVAGFVAAIARSEQAADALTTLVTFVLALVGGNFIPPGELPPLLSRLTWFTPNGWALRGFAELSAGGGSVADVVPHAGVLVAWALVTGVVAARLLPSRLAAA